MCLPTRSAQVPVPVPQRLREIMLGFEAGEPVTRAEVGRVD